MYTGEDGHDCETDHWQGRSLDPEVLPRIRYDMPDVPPARDSGQQADVPRLAVDGMRSAVCDWPIAVSRKL